MKRSIRIPNVSTGPTLFVGGGGAGRDVARLSRTRCIRGIGDLLGLNDVERGEVSEELKKLYLEVYVDSDQWEATDLDPRFASEEPEHLTPPVEYRTLDSPSGRYIIENVNTLPFRHFGDWPRLEDIRNKSSDAEAEGNRLFGETNVSINAREISSQIEMGIAKMRSVVGSNAWQSLVAYGVPVTDKSFRVELCVSLSGGQGTGAVLALLGFVAQQVEDDRERFKINLHALLPGFFRAQSSDEQREQHLKALSVMRDLAALKAGASLEILHPDGRIVLTPRHTTELFNHLFIYQPSSAEKNRYESFISRTSQSIINAELSAAASKLRRSRSNALELARRSYAKRKFAIVGG